MEALEQLERRITALLTELDSLRAENSGLKDGQVEIIASLNAENNALRANLAREQERNSDTLMRIENIVQRLKERTDSE